MEGKLYVVSGPSGTGKGTICHELLTHHPEIELSISCATRAPRPGEIDGVHYHFISEDQFLDMKKNDGFLECAQINGGYWYGTPRDRIEEKVASGKNILLEIETNGARQVFEHEPGTVGVFILPPDIETLIKRLVGRGTEDMDKLVKRMQKVPSELEAAKDYEHLIVNHDVQEAVAQMESVFAGKHVTGQAEHDTLARLTREFSDMDRCMELLKTYYDKMLVC